MPRTIAKAFSYVLLILAATVALGGTASALDFNDDAELDTSQVEDDRGCGTECHHNRAETEYPEPDYELGDRWNPNTDWTDYN